MIHDIEPNLNITQNETIEQFMKWDQLLCEKTNNISRSQFSFQTGASLWHKANISYVGLNE